MQDAGNIANPTPIKCHVNDLLLHRRQAAGIGIAADEGAATLKALLTAESASRPTDFTILREYLRLGGNKVALATQLGISRPALYMRLSAIETKLGVDLSDAESTASLHVAMLALEVRRGSDVGVTPS